MFYRQLPPLNAIKAFDAVVRFGSISKAAKMLVVSQSAVSRHLRNLEDFLDCQLIERHRTGVVLTEAGRDFHEQSSKALSLILEATTALRSKAMGIHLLKIAALSSFTLRWLVPRLSGFQSLHPGIVIDISISDDKPDFRHSDRDGAIVSHYSEDLDPAGTHLFSEELVVVCSPGLLESKPLASYDDLLNHSIIHITTRAELWERWAHFYGHGGGNEKNIGLAVQDFYIAIAAAVAGNGVALVPLVLIEEELRTGALVEPFHAPFISGRDYQLVFAHEKQDDPAALLFKQWLLNEMGFKT